MKSAAVLFCCLKNFPALLLKLSCGFAMIRISIKLIYVLRKNYTKKIW